MAAAALLAAQQFVEGSQEQETKRPRMFAPGPAPSAAGSQDGVLLTQLLRAHLVQTNAVLEATNSTQLVLLVKDEEDKKYFLGLLNAWHQKQREVALTPEQRRAGQHLPLPCCAGPDQSSCSSSMQGGFGILASIGRCHGGPEPCKFWSGVQYSEGWQSLEVEGGYDFVCSRFFQTAVVDSCSTFDAHRCCSLDFGTIQAVPISAHKGPVASLEGASPWSHCLMWRLKPETSLSYFFAVDPGTVFGGSSSTFEILHVFLQHRSRQSVRCALPSVTPIPTGCVMQYVRLFLATSLFQRRRGIWEGLVQWLLPHVLLGTRLPRAVLVLFLFTVLSCRRWTILYGATTTYHSMFFQVMKSEG